MMISERYEGQSFGLPKLPSTIKQPVFSGRLDFRIVTADNIYNVLSNEREQREG
jgi:hypothetical protein